MNDQTDDITPEIPDFEMIRPVGRGGFGEVWLAANRTTGHLRAVKVIPLQHSGKSDPAGREINSITRLEANVNRHHRNLVTIYHVGKTDEHLFYVMAPADDLSGGAAKNADSYRPATLRSRLEAGPLPADECLACAEQLLEGLASLHESGMVHRDVKPANCLFVDGELKLADFGLLTESSPLVSRVGTQRYMPPDGHMDTRADVYAAGLVIYEMISGLPAERFPQLGRRARELADSRVLNRLVRLMLHACQPERENRFADVREMLAELRRSENEPLPKPRRAPMIKATCVVAVLCAVIAGLFAWMPNAPVQPPPVTVNFITEKPFFDAEVYIDGVRQQDPDGTLYTTPCTIPNLPGGEHEVSFRLEGQPELNAGRIDFSNNRQVVGQWGD